MKDLHWNMAANRGKAMMLAKRQLSELVYDAVNLEGILMTLPEVQTLLEGITVGGHRISDQQVAINQGNAWKTLFLWLEQETFKPTLKHTCELHAIAAKEESLDWGKFRSGSVTISGTEYLPPNASTLTEQFEQMIRHALEQEDIYDAAISIFLQMARIQFFYDVNKRMGRFIMNALLLSEGYPAINLPAKRQLEFNQKMLKFYGTGVESPMNLFMRSCLDKRIIQIMKE